MAVSKRLRYEVLRRDNHACRYCGASAPDVKLTIDHVTPVALGGTDTADNLVTSCGPCNSGKTSSAPDAELVADVSADALRWADAMKQAADNLAAQEEPKLEYREAFLTEWNRWGIGEGEDRKSIELPGDWKPSIENFRLAGLPAWVWADIVDAAMGREKVLPESKFKYCCGIAWNKVTGLQKEARRIAASSDPASSEDDDDPTEDAFVEVALTVWGMEWVHAFRKGPSTEEEAAFRASVLSMYPSGEPLHDLIESAEYSAWARSCDLTDGLKSLHDQRQFNRRYRVASAFDSAWYVTHGESAPRETSDKVWEACNAMCDAGADPEYIEIAAVWAGTHGTDRLHYGLAEEHCAITGVRRMQQQIEDFWAAAWEAAALPMVWPSEAERAAFRVELQRLTGDGWHSDHDLLTASVSAGVHRDVQLIPHLPLGGSALLAACLLPSPRAASK